jgi:hypothetical protein
MPFITDGLTTGTLGYKLKKDFLGEGLYYREIETYTYEIYARPAAAATNPYRDISTHLKNTFAARSGDMSYKVLEAPTEYFFPNDHIRVAKFKVEIELRNPVVSIETYNPQLLTNRYKGLDNTFFGTYATGLENFTEDFGFEVKEDGRNVYNHDISFSLYSGAHRDKAVEIAKAIYGQDKNTTLGVNIMPGSVSTIADTGNHVNYFNETYDLIKNSFSFQKKREVLPISASTYTSDLSHSVTLKDNGFIDVTERGSVQGKLTYAQAAAGFDTVYAGAFTRSNAAYNSFKNIVGGTTITTSLLNFPLAINKTFNKPEKSIDYDVTYSNDSNINSTNSTSLEKVLVADLGEDRFLNIDHSYSYGYLVNPKQNNNDANFTPILSAAYLASPAEVQTFYAGSSFFNNARPTMKRLKSSASTPKRGKSFNISMSYTNNPIYFVTLDSETYAILENKNEETKPADILTEYKVINRPNKMSVVSYAYQTEKGSKSCHLTARLRRGTTNVFTTPRPDISTQLLSLYKYAVGKILDEFKGTTVLALSYYLADVKYNVNSEDEINLDVSISYALKKYIQ